MRAHLLLQIDVSFGDVVTPAPLAVAFPTLLDLPAPQVRVYPRETVVAEKFEALVRLGKANTRFKDFYDLWTLAQRFPALHLQGQSTSPRISSGLGPTKGSVFRSGKNDLSFQAGRRGFESRLPLHPEFFGTCRSSFLRRVVTSPLRTLPFPRLLTTSSSPLLSVTQWRHTTPHVVVGSRNARSGVQAR